MSKHFIYLTVNNINGKKYVGRCSDRWKWYNGYLGSGVLLKQAIKKYGKDNFSRSTLQELDCDLKEAIDTEALWIKRLNAVDSEEYYNMSYNSGGFGKGSKHSKISKEKISVSVKKGLSRLTREHYANRVNSGTDREPHNKNIKFEKGSKEWEKTYGKRKRRSKKHTSQDDADMARKQWKAWIASGEVSLRKFLQFHDVSRTQMEKYLKNNFIFEKTIRKKYNK